MFTNLLSKKIEMTKATRNEISACSAAPDAD